ncbi:MAG: HAMP domain-containing histidine kinase [Clostridia bacterium]|nr:HAMP domain-containing histidine kinase [Clostridia bacterium]
MKRSKFVGTLLNFLVFFSLVAFVITCCIMLFISTMEGTMGIRFTSEDITAAAKATMVNVVLISLAFAGVDALRRKFTVHRPVKRIKDATSRMIKGDFNVRIEPVSRFGTEGEFNEIIESVNKMAEELSGVETLRSDFIANVSHEMKTPLAVIGNYGKMLQSDELSDEKRIEYARAVTDASRRLSDMVTNILKLNRLENQKIYPKSEMYDLGEQLCECLLQYENVWERRNIEIETDIVDGVLVSADAELLSLVWNNLFSNAFKFTEDEGRVSVSLTREGKYAVVKVTDTGCGMSADVGSHIFEKFYQGDTSRATSGNGLGLALVKRVVDIMHGEISVESAVGVGSTFSVKIGSAEDVE